MVEPKPPPNISKGFQSAANRCFFLTMDGREKKDSSSLTPFLSVFSDPSPLLHAREIKPDVNMECEKRGWS